VFHVIALHLSYLAGGIIFIESFHFPASRRDPEGGGQPDLPVVQALPC